jgi:hypothetical protein
MQIGSIPAGSTANITTQWTPSLIHFVTDTVPTTLKVDVLGDGVITNLDDDGIQSFSRMLHTGIVTDGYVVPLADGIVLNKNTTYTIANGSGNPLIVNAYSEGYATRFWETLTQTVLAGSGVDIKDFWEVALPNLAATDEINIFYRSGFVQKVTIADIRNNQAFSTYVNDDVYDLRISNHRQTIRAVNLVPTSEQLVYLCRQRRIANLS